MSDWVGTYTTVEAINAGQDLEMPGPTRFRGPKLHQAIEYGKVSEATVDARSKKVLELIKKTRRFADPKDRDEEYLDNPARDDFIARCAAEGAVLLKNKRDVLPLLPNSSVVIIGQHARVPTVGGGGSAKVDSERLISPLMALKDAGVQYTYEPGVPVFGAVPLPEFEVLSRTGPSGLFKPAKPVRLEWFNGSNIGGNPIREQYQERTEYMIKEFWPLDLNAEYCTRMSFDITPKTSGDHLFSILTTGTATIYINGKRAFHREQDQHLQREAFYFLASKFERRFTYPMEAWKTYSIKLESWATEPAALARTVGGEVIQGSAVRFFESVNVAAQIHRAAAAASQADVAIIFTGTTNEFESEGFDRQTMDLTTNQYELISAVCAKNPRTVVVNYSGAPVTMSNFYEEVAGIVQCWFPGQECGHSIAKILTGKVNPSGRLPMTWPKRLEDHACYRNWPTDENDVIRYEEGVFVGYRHYDKQGATAPLFPFGFGLSYTSFALSNTQVLGSLSGPNGKVGICCTVKNTGKRAGKVVVQFYVQPPAEGPVLRPKKELKAFTKPALEVGETEKVNLQLDKYAVSFYDVSLDCWRAMKGVYKVLVGFSAAEIVESAEFEVKEEFLWKGL